MSKFAFVTTHSTILSIEGKMRYDHVYHEDASQPLFYGDDGRMLSELPDIPSALRTAFQIPNTERWIFRIGDKFLSPRYGSGFLSSPQVGRCETFTRVPSALLHADDPKIPEISRKPRTYSIPKIIHQTCSLPIPPEFMSISSDLKARNPHWEYKFYSDKDQHDFIYSAYGWDVLKEYLRINPKYGAIRADLFRYLLMYHYGGVYLDIKSTCALPLDDVLRPTDEFVLCQWDNGPGRSQEHWGLLPELRHIPGGEFQQWHIIAVSGHPLLEAVILSALKHIACYDQRLHGIGEKGTLRCCGPVMYTRTIFPLLTLGNHRFLDKKKSPFIYSATEMHVGKIGTHYKELTTPIIFT